MTAQDAARNARLEPIIARVTNEAPVDSYMRLIVTGDRTVGASPTLGLDAFYNTVYSPHMIRALSVLQGRLIPRVTILDTEVLGDTEETIGKVTLEIETTTGNVNVMVRPLI